MSERGLPVLPGSEVVRSEVEALEWGNKIGYPVMVKAAAGGGGRGMRAVKTPEELPQAFQSAQNEAAAAFGSPDLYLEKFVASPRPIAFQLLGHTPGKAIPPGERESTLQRPHHK